MTTIVVNLLFLILLVLSSASSSSLAQTSATSPCKPDCTKTYAAATQCASDPVCFWSDFTDSCLTRCELIGDRRACGSSASEYLPDSTHCFWRNTTSQCEPKCSRLTNLADCKGASHCVVQESSTATSGFRCLPRCIDISFTILDDIPLTQLPLEVTRPTQELFDLCIAESDGDCVWNVALSLCVRTCAVQHGECLNEQQVRGCNADPRCRFDIRSGGRCVERCGVFSNQVSCSMFGKYRAEQIVRGVGDDGAQSVDSNFVSVDNNTNNNNLLRTCSWNSLHQTCDNNCEFNFALPAATRLASSSSSPGASDLIHEAVKQSCNELASTDCFYHFARKQCVPKCSRFDADPSGCESTTHCVLLSSAASTNNYSSSVPFGGCATNCSNVYDAFSSSAFTTSQTSTAVSSTSSSSSSLSSSGYEDDTAVRLDCMADDSCVWMVSPYSEFVTSGGGGASSVSNLFVGSSAPAPTSTSTSTTRLGCIQRCSQYQDDRQCSSDPSCTYFQTATFAGCVTKCQIRFSPSSTATTSTICEAVIPANELGISAAAASYPRFCQYIDDKVKCRDRCAFLAMYSCLEASLCTWLGSSKRCVLRCSALGSTTSSCTQSTTFATENCELVTLPAVLASSSPSSPSSSASTTSTCLNKCALYETAEDCNRQSHCEYSSASSLCTPRCSAFSQYDGTVASSSSLCLQTLGCTISSEDGECLRNCASFSAPSTTSGTGSTSSSASSECSSKVHCIESSSTSCISNCAFLYASAAACTSDPVCVYTSNFGCVNKCSLINSAAACGFASTSTSSASGVASHGCEWKLSPTSMSTYSCTTSCSLRYSSNQAECLSADAQGLCSWNTNFGCYNKCSQFDLSGSFVCDENPFCVWNFTSKKCRDRCENFDHDQGDCERNNCVWIGKSGSNNGSNNVTTTITMMMNEERSCREPCSAFEPSRDGIMSQQCGKEHSNFSHCVYDSGSSTTMGACVPGCASFLTKSSCGNASCVWLAKFGKCVSSTHCSSLILVQRDQQAQSEQQLTASFASSTSATVSNTNATLCHQNPLCYYHSQTRQCSIRCSCRYLSSLSSASSSSSPFPSLTEMSSCVSDPNCEYFSDLSICGERCNSLNADECGDNRQSTAQNLTSADVSLCEWKSPLPSSSSSSSSSSSTTITTRTPTIASKCSVVSCQKRIQKISSVPLSTAEKIQFCSYDSECFFFNNSCLRNCSALSVYFSAEVCESEPHCFWNYLPPSISISSVTERHNADRCHVRCSILAAVSFEGVCPSSSSSSVSASYICDSILTSTSPSIVHACVESCLTKNESSCNADSTCRWYSSPFASSNNRTNYSNQVLQQSSCGYANSCLTNVYQVSLPSLGLNACSSRNSLCQHFWGAQCGISCSRFSSAGPEVCTSAALEGSCIWNEANVSCITSCYHRTTNVDLCAFDPQCFFSFSTATCHDRCGIIHRPILAGNSEADDTLRYCNSSGYAAPAATTTAALPPPTAWGYCYYDDRLQSCKETCSKRFSNNRVLCQSRTSHDLLCIWNYKTGQCTTDCTASNLVNSKDDCLASGGDVASSAKCFWTGKTCVADCSTVYENETQCNSNPACDFGFATRGGCEQNCAILCPETCRLTSYCEYNATTGVCSRNCTASFPSSASDCNAHADCVWDRKNGVCRDRCSRASQLKFDCVHHSKFSQHCIWVGFGGAGAGAATSGSSGCVESCGATYTVANCPVSGGACQIVNGIHCLDSCDKFLKLAAADSSLAGYCPDSVASCTLYTPTTCARTCEDRDSASCASDGFCFSSDNSSSSSSSSSASCNMKCQYATSASKCNLRSTYCDYFGVWTGVGTCVVNCRSFSSSEALCSEHSSQCIWRAVSSSSSSSSTSSNQCLPICSLMNLDRCTASSSVGCAWNYLLNICENSCQMFYSSSETACKTASSSSSSSSSALLSCTWVPPLNSCRPACERFASVSSCSKSFPNDCFWSYASQKCMLKCSVKYPVATAASLCVADPVCFFVASSSPSNLCIDSCYHFSTSQSCSASRFCTWSSVRRRCVFDCSLDNTSTATAGCSHQWCEALTYISNATASAAATTTSCVPKCSLYSSSSLECSSNASTCVSTSSSSSSGLCLRHCSVRYPFMQNKSACVADKTRCVWDEAKQVCQNACHLFSSDQQACENSAKNDRQCVWFEGSCVQSCESKYGFISVMSSSSSTSSQNSSFLYNSCTTLESSARCAPSPAKSANTSSVFCTDSCHVFDYSPSRCMSRSDNCVWDSVALKCRSRCGDSLFSSSKELCTTGSGGTSDCDWIPPRTVLTTATTTSSGSCAFACSTFASESDCSKNYYCRWLSSSVLSLRALSLSSSSSSSSTTITTQNATANTTNGTTTTMSESSSSSSAGGFCARNCQSFYEDQTAERDFDACESEPHCSVRNSHNNADSKMLCRLSCSLFSASSALCQQQINCHWLGATRECAPICSTRTNSSSSFCQRDPNCVFIPQTSSCEVSCSSFDFEQCVGSFSTPASTLNKCMWDPSSSQCRPSCQHAHRHEKSSCEADSMCLWNDFKKRCAFQCGATTTTSTTTSGGDGGGAKQCVSRSSAGHCRWMTKTPSRDAENGIDKAEIRFLTFGWELPAPIQVEIGEGFDDNSMLTTNVFGSSSISTTTFIDDSGCHNSSLVRVVVDSSYDDAVKSYDSVAQLTHSAKQKLRREFGIVNPIAVASAEGIINSGYKWFMLLLLLVATMINC